MSDILRDTDLTKVDGDPGDRATWYSRRERCHFEFGMPTWLGGLIMKLETQTAEGSPLAMTITAVMLAMVGCAVAAVSILAGASMPITVAGFLAPAAFFFLIFLAVHLASRRAK